MDQALKAKKDSASPDRFHKEKDEVFVKKYTEDMKVVTQSKGFRVFGNAEKRPLPVKHESDDEW